MAKRKKSDIDNFVGLSDAQKERIVKQLDRETPEQSIARSRPLNAKEPWHSALLAFIRKPKS